MEIFEILAFIFLISIIFGVSMHDAFWGIVAFVACFIVGAIVLVISSLGFNRIKNKVEFLNSPEGKIYRQNKKEAKKRRFVDNLIEGIILLWIFSPLLVAALIGVASAQNPEFAKVSGPVTALILVAIYVVPILILLINRKKTKKRTNRKS